MTIKKMKRCVIFVIMGLYLYILITFVVDAIKYQSYDSKTTAIINDIEIQHAHVSTFAISEYKIQYTYYIDNISYERKSSWMTSVPDLHIGQEITVRFKTKNPAASILEIEKSDKSLLIIATCLCFPFAIEYIVIQDYK